MLPAELLALVVQHFGPVDLVADLSWLHVGSAVYHVRDSSGIDHIVKRLESDDSYLQEYAGLQSACVLGPSHAPQLEAADPLSRTLVSTLPPGMLLKQFRLREEELCEVHGKAGALLRRLHDSAPSIVDTAELDLLLSWVGRNQQPLVGALTDAQWRTVRGAAERLSRLSHRVPAVPTHGGLWAQNILFDPKSRSVALIDFENAAVAPAVRDFLRLETGVFLRSPHARAAFYEGYGRYLDAPEQEMLHGWAVLDAASELIRGILFGDQHLVEHARKILTDKTTNAIGPKTSRPSSHPPTSESEFDCSRFRNPGDRPEDAYLSPNRRLDPGDQT